MMGGLALEFVAHEIESGQILDYFQAHRTVNTQLDCMTDELNGYDGTGVLALSTKTTATHPDYFILYDDLLVFTWQKPLY